MAQRLAHILAQLHQGDTINKLQLAQKYAVNVRTIERDLCQRLTGIAERNPNGQWQLTKSARGTIPANLLNTYARMVGTDQIYPDASLPYLLEQIETPEHQRATQVQAVPQENLRAHDPAAPKHFAQLEAAIAQRHPCQFSYKGKTRHVQPYRLIHRNGVWYLAAEEKAQLKNYSVALIVALQVDESSQFATKREHLDYLQSKDDVWFTPHTTEVLLRVSPAVAHYFVRRPLLPRQQQRTDADGSLVVTAHINHINQLLPMVRYWLPNVRILQPMEWHDALVDGLKTTIAQWGH